MEAGQIKGHQFSIVASRINISRTVPSSLYVTQRIPSMIAKNQVFSTNFFGEQTMANDFIGKMNTQLCLYNTMSFKTALEYIHIHVACYCL